MVGQSGTASAEPVLVTSPPTKISSSVVAAVSTDKRCGDNLFPAFDVFSCGNNATSSFDFPALGDQFAGIAASYSTLHVERGCVGDSSDHFAMWEIGVPALVYSEHSPFANLRRIKNTAWN